MDTKITTLAQALLKFQAEAETLQKDSINPHFKNSYIGLDSLVEKVLPLLNKHGIVVLQLPSIAEGSPALTTSLIHAESGQMLNSQMFLVLDRDNPQGQGSAITYARRYALMSILGLVADTDDDGQSASQSGTKRTYRKSTRSFDEEHGQHPTPMRF